jgi:hypothetical protein
MGWWYTGVVEFGWVPGLKIETWGTRIDWDWEGSGAGFSGLGWGGFWFGFGGFQ